MSETKHAVVVKGLTKSYGSVKVLKGVTFSVGRGSILALLGPNGAGKTTTIRILSTLLLADGGQASVNGYDVKKESDQVRASIGLTGQFAAVDEYLTAKENLEMIGRLYRLPRAEVDKRTETLLKQVDLVESSQRTVKTYSGGMKRRVDLAMSLIAQPPVIFLDEPTTGLDPRSRMQMWKMIRKLASEGTAILLTTQYMDEADHLADEIVVIDDGKVIAQGSPKVLKQKAGADRLDVIIAKAEQFAQAVQLIGTKTAQIEEDTQTISLATKNGVSTVRDVLKKLDEAKVDVESVSLRQPTLDDVFMTLTGHHSSSNRPSSKQSKKKKGKK